MSSRQQSCEQFRVAVREAAARPDVAEAIARVYADLQREIDRRRPRCEVSGRCCRFEEFGHRLYVTTLEMAAFVGQVDQEGIDGAFRTWDGSGCPFQSGRLCTVHAIRPFGCRIFFCDSTSTTWQSEQYEQLHTRIRRLHEEMNVPYFYIEWREALRMLRQS